MKLENILFLAKNGCSREIDRNVCVPEVTVSRYEFVPSFLEPVSYPMRVARTDFNTLSNMTIKCFAYDLYKNSYSTLLGSIYLGSCVSASFYDLSSVGNAFDYAFNIFKNNYIRYSDDEERYFSKYRVTAVKNKYDRHEDFDTFEAAKQCYDSIFNEGIESDRRGDKAYDVIKLETIFRRNIYSIYGAYTENTTICSICVHFNLPYGGIKYNRESFELYLGCLPNNEKQEHFVDYAKEIFERVRKNRVFNQYS